MSGQLPTRLWTWRGPARWRSGGMFSCSSDPPGGPAAMAAGQCPPAMLKPKHQALSRGHGRWPAPGPWKGPAWHRGCTHGRDRGGRTHPHGGINPAHREPVNGVPGVCMPAVPAHNHHRAAINAIRSALGTAPSRTCSCKGVTAGVFLARPTGGGRTSVLTLMPTRCVYFWLTPLVASSLPRTRGSCPETRTPEER